MRSRLVLATALGGLIFTACSGGDPEDPDGGVVVDMGNTGPVDMGPRPDTGPAPDMGPGPDMGPRPDMGPEPDMGPGPDMGPIDMGPPPPVTVTASGQVTKYGAYLGGNNEYVGQAGVLAYGVQDVMPVQSQDPNGNYSVELPANGQVVMVTTKAGYVQTFNALTTADQPIPDKKLYLAESAWLSEIATAHNVQLTGNFPCQTASLAGENCVYSAIVGQILDDGTAGAGTLRPVGGIAAGDISVTGPGQAPWYTRGPYFLDYTGTSSAAAQASIAYQNGAGEYLGGYYIVFVEVPFQGPQFLSFELGITYPYQGNNRYFGPATVQAFRGPNSAVNIATIYETGVAPMPPPIGDVDFDTQIYPLFSEVEFGGLGCVGCHTNQGGAIPAGGMNLYGGPGVAYDSLRDPAYPNRVNLASPADSYLLVRPLYEANGVQDHPIFAFASPQDPGYQLILTWITDGAIRNAPLPPVSFYNEVRPLLSQPSNNGGMGCVTCHDQAGNAGGFYASTDGNTLYDELANEAPNNPGQYNEAYRINKDTYPERSLVLVNPLFGNPEPHPVKLLFDNTDPRYQTIYRWISEGYVNDTP